MVGGIWVDEKKWRYFWVFLRSLSRWLSFLALGVTVSCGIVTLLMGWLTFSCCF